MDVTHSPACREVLIVSGVSILNDSVFKKVFKVLRSRMGLHRLLGLGTKIAGCKNLVNSDFAPVRLHFCLSADAVPPQGRTVWWVVVVAQVGSEPERKSITLPQCGDYLWTQPQGFPFLPTLV